MDNRNVALVPGSLGAVARDSHTSLAESFLSADAIVIVDTSGSMAAHDSRDGQSRFETACQEMRRLQQDMPGKLAVVGFSSHPQFEPTGIPTYQGGGTDLAAALRFVAAADGCVRFVVVSDGQPDDAAAALAVAAKFTSRIDVVYVGPEDERSGREFLERLARASGGQFVTADRAQELAERVEALLLKSGN